MSERRTIVWLASYPKSGNTWLRFLACNLQFGPQQSAATVGRLAPDLHELDSIPALPAARSLMKTHFVFSAQLPLGLHTAAAVYIVRHPADVMLSNFHYSRRSGAATDSRGALDAYVQDFIGARGDPRWLQLGMGTWEENVRSWLSQPHPFPVLRLRYEDVLSDALGAAHCLCAFLGLERSPEQVAAAVRSASFESLRKIEERDIASERVGIFYKPYLRASIDAGLRFMRAGRAGDAAAVLPAEQRQRFAAAFGDSLHALGYDSVALS